LSARPIDVSSERLTNQLPAPLASQTSLASDLAHVVSVGEHPVGYLAMLGIDEFVMASQAPFGRPVGNRLVAILASIAE
jgi:hypothetical protein